MALLGSDNEASSRRAVIRTFVIEGTAGVVVLLWATIARMEETRGIFAALGADALPLLALFVLLTFSVALLRFKMTEKVFVTFTLTACTAMFPLLGAVMSAWIAAAASITVRILGLMQIGPNKIPDDDRSLEVTRTFAQFGLYGIPVTLAAVLFEMIGGTIPLREASSAAFARVALAGLVMQSSNNLMMVFNQRALGYGWRKIAQTTITDHAIFILAVPYAIMLALSYSAAGWWMVVGLAFTGIVTCAVGRKLAITMSQSQQQVERLASLTTIGRMISLDRTQDALLETIYEECSKVLDTSQFAIALVDEDRAVLRFELDVVDAKRRPREEIRLGDGLSSWVVAERKPLLLTHASDEEARLGLNHVEDGLVSESWLGVPMIARARVIGLIVVQNQSRNIFAEDDVILLTAIANQAAIALENAALYRDLEAKVEKRTAEIEEKVHQLELSESRAIEAERKAREASRTKSTFLANMSHELRTPLNAILGFVQLMFRSPQRAPEDRESLEIISRSGEHLLGLINDVLSISKIEAGELTLNACPFHPQKLLSGLDEMFSRRARAAGVELAIEQRDPLPGTLVGDEGKLRQVLINLLGNAVKFTEKGRVTLRVAYSAPSARFEVDDTGPGIRAKDRERIFDAFAQTPMGVRGGEGSGLGLAISRNYVRLMGGEIEVVSSPGAGSSFRFTIPLPPSDERVAERPPRVARLAPGQPRFRILVAEDRDESRILLVRLMSIVGFEVCEAVDGARAVEVWEAWRPHLVWMDIRMPVFSGYEATRQIRAREAQRSTDPSIVSDEPRRTCIIALTASVFEHDREDVLAAGCDDFIAKPFQEGEVFQKMRSHLGLEYVYEAHASPPPPSQPMNLTASRLATVPRESLETLALALTRGDLRAAGEIIEEIRRGDESLGMTLSSMLKSYRLDEMQELLEARR